jgi:hypothetical protein
MNERTIEEKLIGANRMIDDLNRIADLLRAENRAHETTIADLRAQIEQLTGPGDGE